MRSNGAGELGVGVLDVADVADAAGLDVAVEEGLEDAMTPAALIYSYIDSLEFPPHISAEFPAQAQEQPAFPSGAGPPPFENVLPQ